MSSEKYDLFLILLRLKSYLISLLDDPSLGFDGFEYTLEYLDRKFPERKEEIIELLLANQIQSDSQIAFDEKIHYKFREMVNAQEKFSDLSALLEKYNIATVQQTVQEKGLEKFRTLRDKMLKEIVTNLYQIASAWTQRSEIENRIQDYSLLDEEELIRPEERKKLNELDENTSYSYQTISNLTQQYLHLLIEYYFTFGGDISLVHFIDSLDDFKKSVYKKYFNLIRNSGLDPNKL